MAKKSLVIFVLLMLQLLQLSSSIVYGACPFDRVYSFGSSSSSSSPSSAAYRLASNFHLPLPQPYTYTVDDPTTALFYGASFTTPNSTLMPRWFYFEKGIPPLPFNVSLLKQLNSFENLLAPFCFSHDRCLQKLNNALFSFDQLGVNDYLHMLSHGRKSVLDVSKLVPQVVETIKGKLEGLIRFGARNLFVSGSPPIGCFQYTKFLRAAGGSEVDDEFHYDSNKCNAELNMFATLHNDHLQQALYELRHEFPHVRVVYMDYYKAFTRRNGTAEAMGFNSKRLMKLCGGTEGSTQDIINPAKAKQCGVSGTVPNSVCKEDPAATGGQAGDNIHRDHSSCLANKAARRNIFNPLWQFM